MSKYMVMVLKLDNHDEVVSFPEGADIRIRMDTDGIDEEFIIESIENNWDHTIYPHGIDLVTVFGAFTNNVAIGRTPDNEKVDPDAKSFLMGFDLDPDREQIAVSRLGFMDHGGTFLIDGKIDE